MSTELKAAIDAQNQKLMEAFHRSDFKTMAQIYTEDCKVMEPGAQESFGREGVEKVFSRQKQMGAKRVKLDTDEIGSLGPEICFERHTYTTYKEADEILEEGKSLVIWKLVDGEWKAYIDIFNSNTEQE